MLSFLLSSSNKNSIGDYAEIAAYHKEIPYSKESGIYLIIFCVGCSGISMWNRITSHHGRLDHLKLLFFLLAVVNILYYTYSANWVEELFNQKLSLHTCYWIRCFLLTYCWVHLTISPLVLCSTLFIKKHFHFPIQLPNKVIYWIV